MQNRLNRVIAWSSVENSGLIVVGFGVALTGAAVGDPRLVAAGLLAATLQMVAHTTAKSLLFTSAAGLEADGDDLELLRGAGRRVPAWRSATMGVEGADSYTAFGYANPARRVLASVLHTRAELRPVLPDDEGDGAEAGSGPHLEYTSDVVEVVGTYLYRPGRVLFEAVVTAAKRLQSGRLDAYLLYMLIALIAIIATVTALA